MKIKLLFCAFGACISFASPAQETYPTVVAPGGGDSKTSSVVLEWTLGELVAESAFSAVNIYTQGFHQPVLSLEKTGQVPELAASKIEVYPNPATSAIYVKIGFNHALPLNIILLDSKGSILLKKDVPSEIKQVDLNVNRFSRGAYTLQIRNTDGRILQSYRVIKAQ